jgi:hypothetical protein
MGNDCNELDCSLGSLTTFTTPEASKPIEQRDVLYVFHSLTENDIHIMLKHDLLA